ncbi:hypothetical protein WN51_03257 [Melipona quadrifasciata]|uniref:Uncharacterized protein n=1 Tax=Melipona quadrifasciata TaxID=166423 RepID=A0A0M8ZW07_9HYME|nr:hypothetical protein WN51_03257 [Melipona quadrifasciata]
MYAIQSTVRRAPRLLNICQNQRRTILGTPPRVRIALAEKVVLGMVFWLGAMAYPLYVSCNINKWNNREFLKP